MVNVLQFISDVLAMLNTPEGQKVVADLEAIAGITPQPPPSPTPQPTVSPTVTTPTASALRK